MWIPVSTLPPRDPKWIIYDYESIEVLMTDGKQILVGRFHQYEEESYWKITGRDGYTFENVTHWMMLPKLPS